MHLEGDEWMVQEKRGRRLALLRKEPVLCIAAVCAAVSTLLNPPSPAYLNYIDWRVLTLLFCLMAVVAGLQECGVFAVLAQRLLAGERRMRLASLISLKVYLRTPGARPGRYLLLFTAANGAALVLLCLCAALLAG